MSDAVNRREGGPGLQKTLLVAETEQPVVCAKGMRVIPDVTTSACPHLDVLLIPGGQGTRREVDNVPLLAWIAAKAARAQWVTSVCTGALLLTAAGPARGKRVTTHWAMIEALRARGEASQVLSGVRYVQDGNVVTSAGVSAGIDMSLWLTGQMHGVAFAQRVQRAMEYDPAPPFAKL